MSEEDGRGGGGGGRRRKGERESEKRARMRLREREQAGGNQRCSGGDEEREGPAVEGSCPHGDVSLWLFLARPG